MNKILKGLLLAALAMGAAQVQAHTNKTFMMPRPAGVNLAMEYTTFNELVNRKDNDKFGANFQVTGFYQASTNGERAGKYFGINNKDTINLNYEAKRPGTITPPAVVPNPGNPCTASTVNCDLDLGYILHDRAGELQGKVASINFDPEQRVYGARLDYYQDLEKIVKGLYLTAALPVVHVENNMNMSLACGTIPACGPCTPCAPTTNVLTPATAADAALNTRVLNYFKGCTDVSFVGVHTTGDVLDNLAVNNTQAPLTKAKINGKRSETGVADIDVKLGYKFLDKENYMVALNLGVTFPTGNEAKGNYVFEPIVGNGQHWGFGFGMDSLFRVWSNEESNLKFALMFNYRYLFENDECRTLGLNAPAVTPAVVNNCPTPCDKPRCSTARNWGQYALLGDNKTVVAPFTLIPAANLTTLNVNVTPGSQFDGIAAFTYNHGGWTLDLGYNLYLREGERVKLRNAGCATACPTPVVTPATNACNPCGNTGCASTIEAKRYGVASRGFDTNRAINAGGTSGTPANPVPANSQFGNATGAFAGSTSADAVILAARAASDFDGCAVSFIDCSSLNTCVAETPSQNSHKLFVGAGYIFKEWDNPLMLGLGGSYEWANSAALDQWSVSAKIGIGF